jgi:hypothetical protein
LGPDEPALQVGSLEAVVLAGCDGSSKITDRKYKEEYFTFRAAGIVRILHIFFNHSE